MKLITALIRPEKLEAIQQALDEPGIQLMAISRAVDPREPCPRERYRGLEIRIPRARLRIEVVVVNEALLDCAIRAIARSGSAGEPRPLGEGDILVTTLEQYVACGSQGSGTNETEEDGSILPPLHLGSMRQ